MSYYSKIESEIYHFEQVENVHDLPSSCHYLSNKFLTPLLEQRLGVSGYEGLILKHFEAVRKSKSEEQIKILSLGSGNCDFEINFAAKNKIRAHFDCVELNDVMLARGAQYASAKGLAETFNFIKADINETRFDQKFDLILANHSLHHFVKLEHIFDQVHEAMGRDSYFVINDMIGRNGHLFWDGTFDLCNRLWAILPRKLKFNHQLKQRFATRVQFDCSTDGFEGIRAQDILPELDKRFKFINFATFSAITNKFVDRDFGHNFDITVPLHKAFLDFVGELDHYVLTNKLLKPTQIVGSLMRNDASHVGCRYTYFEHPKDVYELPDKTFYEIFDFNLKPSSRRYRIRRSIRSAILKRLVSRIRRSVSR